jgi:hypothetical protein
MEIKGENPLKGLIQVIGSFSNNDPLFKRLAAAPTIIPPIDPAAAHP